MTDRYGWTDERYRRANEDTRRREPQSGVRGPYRAEEGYGADDAGGDYGSGWYGEDAALEGYAAPGPYGRPAEAPYGGRSDSQSRPYSHERYLREQKQERSAGEHRGRGPSDYVRSDERIHEDVNDRLTEDGWLDASDVQVKVHKGEVTLGGLIGKREDKRRAEAITESVYGVKHVQNNLRLRDASMAKPGDDRFKESKSDYNDGSIRSN